jgi:putative nucleotidyltransferase with HDIG domain
MANALSKEILVALDTLPPLSDSVSALLPVVSKEAHSARDVVDVLERDPILAARILKVANSAAYARRVPAETVMAAASYLGDMTVIGLALRLGNAKTYDGGLEGYGAVRGALWEHSLKVAIAARMLAFKAKVYLSPGVAYTAGLMHDIGKVVLSSFLKGSIAVQGDFLEQERAVTKTDHAAVGAALAQRWKMPPSICAAVAWHHEPKRADPAYASLVYVVHLADMAAMLGGAGTGGDTLAYRLDEGYMQYFDISRKEMFKVINQMDLEFEKINEALGGA